MARWPAPCVSSKQTEEGRRTIGRGAAAGGCGCRRPCRQGSTPQGARNDAARRHARLPELWRQQHAARRCRLGAADVERCTAAVRRGCGEGGFGGVLREEMKRSRGAARERLAGMPLIGKPEGSALRLNPAPTLPHSRRTPLEASTCVAAWYLTTWGWAEGHACRGARALCLLPPHSQCRRHLHHRQSQVAAAPSRLATQRRRAAPRDVPLRQCPCRCRRRRYRRRPALPPPPPRPAVHAAPPAAPPLPRYRCTQRAASLCSAEGEVLRRRACIRLGDDYSDRSLQNKWPR